MQSIHLGRGGAGHQGACRGRCLHQHHQVGRKVQVDAGDHPSCEVHQGVRKEAVVEAGIGAMKPGRGKGTSTPVVSLARRSRKGGCTPDLCMLSSEGLSDLALDCGHLPSILLDEVSSEVLLSFPWPPGAGQPHKQPYCAEVRRAGAGASGPGVEDRPLHVLSCLTLTSYLSQHTASPARTLDIRMSIHCFLFSLTRVVSPCCVRGAMLGTECSKVGKTSKSSAKNPGACGGHKQPLFPCRAKCGPESPLSEPPHVRIIREASRLY